MRLDARTQIAKIILAAAALGACSGSHASVPDPPAALVVELEHEEPFVEQTPEGGSAHLGYSTVDAFAVYDFYGGPAVNTRVVGACTLTEEGKLESNRWTWRDVDVGTVDVQLPARTVTVATVPDGGGPVLGLIPHPNEWNDGDTLTIQGSGNASFSPFTRQFRVASRVQVTSPPLVDFRTKVARGRDLVVKWSSTDLEQDAVVSFYVAEWVVAERLHARRVRCRGNGGALVVPASVVAFIADTTWTPTYRVWCVVGEREEQITTDRGTVTIRSRTPFISGSPDNWTPIDVE
jgi:hypothetical protein